MMWSEKIGNEVYVYHNGSLVYKKWIDTGVSVIFNTKGHGMIPIWNTEKH